MKRLEVSGAVRPIYGSLGVKRLSTAVQVFPWPFFPDIAPSRMFTTNSFCLTVCPIHEWRLFFFLN